MVRVGDIVRVKENVDEVPISLTHREFIGMRGKVLKVYGTGAFKMLDIYFEDLADYDDGHELDGSYGFRYGGWTLPSTEVKLARTSHSYCTSCKGAVACTDHRSMEYRG